MCFLDFKSKSKTLKVKDDGLAAINNANGPKLERIETDIIALFKSPSKQILSEQNF